jgi:hypothetical protein
MIRCSNESSRRWLSDFSSGLKAAWNERIVPWMLLWMLIAFTALVIGSASGCTRAVLVPESSPMRIGPETAARVYCLDQGEWVLSENRVMIPEGWYLVPPSYVEK